MKHTKNILKSLLITVMALSLLSVSCSKDEKPTAPSTPITITADAINGSLSFADTVVGDFKITTTGTADYTKTVNITVKNSSGSGSTISGNDFKTAIESMLSSSLIDGANTAIEGTITAQTTGNAAMEVKLKVTPTSPNKFDTEVKGVQSDALTITLSFKPEGNNNWAQ